jgi:flavin-binding protein dodecin
VRLLVATRQLAILTPAQWLRVGRRRCGRSAAPARSSAGIERPAAYSPVHRGAGIIESDPGPHGCHGQKGENNMAKKAAGDGVYRVTEVIGTSRVSWEDAAKNAVSVASKTLRDLRIAEVSKLDMKVEGGKIVAYRCRVQLSFKYDG